MKMLGTSALSLSLVFALMLGFAGLALADNEAYVQQVGAGPYNGVGIQIIQAGDGNVITGTGSVLGYAAAYQNAAGGNAFEVIQTGNNNTVSLEQSARLYSATFIDQDGDGNLVVGAKLDMSGTKAQVDAGEPVLQTTARGYDYLDVSQDGGNNTLGLYQSAGRGDNDAVFNQSNDNNTAAVYQVTTGNGNNTVRAVQNGSDTVGLYQSASGGHNDAQFGQSGGSNEAIVYQNINNRNGNNTVDVFQSDGDNKVVGAEQDPLDPNRARIVETASAQQITDRGYNYLEVTQTGGDNMVGLYQSADRGYNEAVFDQGGTGANEAAVFQLNTDRRGNNIVNVIQSIGGDTDAKIYQQTNNGDNVVIYNNGWIEPPGGP